MEDDPVVSEFDLYISSEMGQKSFMMQFPLISRNAPPPSLEQISINKENGFYSLQLSASLDLFSGFEQKPSSLHATRVPLSQPMAMGVIRGNQIHLTPITQFYQARPLDKEELKTTTGGMEVMDFVSMTDLNKFISASSSSISSDISGAAFKDLLTGMKCEFSSDLLESIDESNLSSYPPREQLYYKLLTERVILFDDTLKSLNLSAYADDLIEIMLRYAYFINGRWVIKSEHIKETDLPIGYRIARNFIIVLFANKVQLTSSKVQKFKALFEVKPEDLSKIFHRIGVKPRNQKADPGSQPGESVITFSYLENGEFEAKHKDAAKRAQGEIQKMKDSICLIRQDPHLFDDFL